MVTVIARQNPELVPIFKIVQTDAASLKLENLTENVNQLHYSLDIQPLCARQYCQSLKHKKHCTVGNGIKDKSDLLISLSPASEASREEANIIF